jgi:hypothetical protein
MVPPGKPQIIKVQAILTIQLPTNVKQLVVPMEITFMDMEDKH